MRLLLTFLFLCLSLSHASAMSKSCTNPKPTVKKADSPKENNRDVFQLIKKTPPKKKPCKAKKAAPQKKEKTATEPKTKKATPSKATPSKKTKKYF